MRNVIIVVGLVCMVSCATPYQPRGVAGGYTDIQMSEDVFRVAFSGNGMTRANTVYNYYLYRCAEVAKINGARYFEILDERESTSTSTTYSSRVVGENVRTTSNDISKSAMSGKIKIYTDRPNNVKELYDVEMVLHNIQVRTKESIKKKHKDYWGVSSEYEL